MMLSQTNRFSINDTCDEVLRKHINNFGHLWINQTSFEYKQKEAGWNLTHQHLEGTATNPENVQKHIHRKLAGEDEENFLIRLDQAPLLYDPTLYETVIATQGKAATVLEKIRPKSKVILGMLDNEEYKPFIDHAGGQDESLDNFLMDVVFYLIGYNEFWIDVVPPVYTITKEDGKTIATEKRPNSFCHGEIIDPREMIKYNLDPSNKYAKRRYVKTIKSKDFKKPDERMVFTDVYFTNRIETYLVSKKTQKEYLAHKSYYFEDHSDLLDENKNPILPIMKVNSGMSKNYTASFAGMNTVLWQMASHLDWSGMDIIAPRIVMDILNEAGTPNKDLILETTRLVREKSKILPGASTKFMDVNTAGFKALREHKNEVSKAFFKKFYDTVEENAAKDRSAYASMNKDENKNNYITIIVNTLQDVLKRFAKTVIALEKQNDINEMKKVDVFYDLTALNEIQMKDMAEKETVEQTKSINKDNK